MELSLFLKVLFQRVKLLLEDLGQVKDEWFEFLPVDFDLMALLSEYEEKPIKLPDLRKMLEDIANDDYSSTTKVYHAVTAALKIYGIEIEWPEASEEQPEDDKDKGKGTPAGSEEDEDEGFPNSEKMQTMAEAWKEYSSGLKGETLKQALARSFSTLERKEWMEEMTKALRKAGIRKIKVGNSDYSNFKISSALKGLIKSKTDL